VIIKTGSPEIADVPGAVRCTVEVTDVPCGMCFSTAFYDADGGLVRLDQHVDAFRAFDQMTGTVGAYTPPTL
jgi:hypothetical protein